jgi:hypothetical protein
MFAYIWRFLTDAEAFQAALGDGGVRALFERIKVPLKVGLLTLGGMLITGQIDLGPKAWWVSPFLLGASSLLQKSGVPDLANMIGSMTDSQKQQLAVHLAPLVKGTT